MNINTLYPEKILNESKIQNEIFAFTKEIEKTRSQFNVIIKNIEKYDTENFENPKLSVIIKNLQQNKEMLIKFNADLIRISRIFNIIEK
jgi:hypothetical protein